MWKSSLKAVLNANLEGDRLNLPASCLDEVLRGHDSSEPLSFELVNDLTRGKIYSSVREFTAAAGTVEIARNTWTSLGLNEHAATVTVSRIRLQKGIYAKLAPLDHAYLEIRDIRSTLEGHLRKNYGTLTKGEELIVTEYNATARAVQEYKILVVELNTENEQDATGCLITDQDIAVDIQPIDEKLAEQAVRQKHANLAAAELGVLTWDKSTNSLSVNGFVREEEYRYYKIPVIDVAREYVLDCSPSRGDADVFVSLTNDRPSLLDHMYFNVDLGVSSVPVRIEGDSTPFIFVSIRGFAKETDYHLSVAAVSAVKADAPAHEENSMSDSTIPNAGAGPGTKQCENCGSFVREQVYEMHHAFCSRNNVKCPDCNLTMSRTDMKEHWHCESCGKVGNVREKEKHMHFFHSALQCECGQEIMLPELAYHRASVCNERIHICRFCHLLFRAGPPSTNAKDILLGGMSSHEAECGARTTTCIKCKSAVQLKDVQMHAQMHEHQKQYQSIFKLCANNLCSSPISDKFQNSAQLCQSCYAPFWTSRADPGNQKFAQKLSGLYFSQLTVGCGKEFCTNVNCAQSSSSPMDTTSAAIKTIELLKLSIIGNSSSPQYWLCKIVGESAQKRRMIAERLVALGFSLAWCVKALQEKNNENDAAQWLLANAPTVQ